MATQAHRHTVHRLPKQQLDILSQLAAAPRPKGAIPGHVKHLIPNRGLEEAAAQAQALRDAGISARFEGTHLRLDSKASYNQALVLLFEKRVDGWLTLLPTLRQHKLVSAPEIREALGKLVGKARPAVRGR